MQPVKNLIFDLGGVIVDLSVDNTLKAFSKLSGLPVSEITAIYQRAPGFIDYEKGKMDDAAFRQYLKEIYNVNVSDEKIDACWNAMLCGIAPAKLRLLKQLQHQYHVYLLSNTNDIHLNYINAVLLPAVSPETSLDIYHTIHIGC